MPSVPKIVVKRLHSATGESHPDADLLTAFAEQSLAGRERDDVVEHLARCGDCREVLSIALPPQVDPQPLTDSTSNWFRWPVLRWATVAAGVALIASLGNLQYRAQHTKQLASNAFDEKQAIATPPQSPNVSTQPVLPQSPIQKNISAPRSETMETNAKPHLSDGTKQSPAPSAPARLSPDSGPAQKKIEAQAESKQVTAATSAQSQMQDQVAQDAPAESSQADRVAKAKPAQAASSTLAPAPSLHMDPVVMKSRVVPRWSINAAGMLQRSLDGGKTWLDVHPASAESAASNVVRSADTETRPVIFRSLSVSSNAAEIWAGGSSGALYHTTDGGNRWDRIVPSDAGITVTGDITSLQFTDPRNGTLATSAAEVWITTDDGQTWHKRQ